MDEVKNCLVCATVMVAGALFCHKCGYQARCKSCHTALPEGANNCVACGETVIKVQSGNISPINSIRINENQEGRSYEIAFSNDVGHEIKEVLADLLKQKITGPESVATTPSAPGEIPLPAFTHQEMVPEQKEEDQVEVQQDTLPQYPHLNDLEIKLNLKENEWLMLFAFFISDFGTATFTKESVWKLYKEKRLTETRFKNLGTNWKSLFKKYISTIKDDIFKFTPAGLAKAKLLATGAGSGKVNRSKASRIAYATQSGGVLSRMSQVSRKTAAATIIPDEFDAFKTAEKDSLESFFMNRKPGAGNPNRIITIAYYITRINRQPYFTEGNIDFAYRLLNLGGKPVHLKQILVNLKNDRIWFKKVIENGIAGWQLTRQGELYVEDKLGR